MAEPNSFKGGDGTKANQECPQPEIWVQVAAGVLSDEDSLHYLEHAALCPACSAQLKEALEIVGPNTSPPASIQEALTLLFSQPALLQIRLCDILFA